MMGVCGGYEEGETQHCGHVYSKMQKYNDATAVDDAIAIVEEIRAYWMRQADFQEKFQANIKFRTQEEIPAGDIESQFTRSESRYFLTVGEIDCPTGNIVVADPLAYLGTAFSPILAEKIPAGKYPVMVSICRHEDIGLRMCTAKLKVKDTKPIKYIRAKSDPETAIKVKDGGTMDGFPVDAGVMCFIDAQVANEYNDFLDKWHQEHPDDNHYDDYFAEFFAQSYEAMPAYQREGGDFIEWANPETGNKMVMVSSGLGDGFYLSYNGYDEAGDIAEIIVPLVNPEIFGA